MGWDRGVPQLPGSQMLGMLVLSLEVQFPKAFPQISKEELGGGFGFEVEFPF